MNRRRVLRIVLCLLLGLVLGHPGPASLAAQSSAPGGVWLWGDYPDDATGSCNNGSTATPAPVGGLPGVTAVATGAYHVLALTADGTVWAWGENQYGQLGLGTSGSAVTTPTQVPWLSGITALATGPTAYHSLAIASDGTVWAWGDNFFGQLGDGTTTNRAAPVQVPGLSGVVAAAVGSDFSLVVKADGSVWGWGYNGNNQLGPNPYQPATPVQVPGISGATAVAAGDSHALALRADGTVWSWGDNSFGQLGHGTTDTSAASSAPAAVVGLANVTGVAAGRFHSLAVRSDGTVWAWGQNGSGRLGNGTTANSAVPVQAGGLTGATRVAAGGNHSLALTVAGTVWAWGDNFYGQLGTGSCTTTASTVPVQASTPGSTATLAAGFLASLAVVASPVATLNPTSLTFGQQKVGTTSATQAVTLTNRGQAPLTITSISTSGDFAQTNTCGTLPATLGPGANCVISVGFIPGAAGTRSGALVVADNAADSPQTVTLNGTGTVPLASVSPTNLTFGTLKVGSPSPPQVVTVTNTGTADLIITSITASGDFAASPGAGCVVVAPGATCTISVTFTPTTSGTRTGTLTITDDAAGSPQTVALSGSGRGTR